MLTYLTSLYQIWCYQQGLPHIDARELTLSGRLSQAQRSWLARFSAVWAHFER